MLKDHTSCQVATDDVWLTEPQVRRQLQLSASTIRRLRTRGLPCIGQYRLRRYHLPTVLQWLPVEKVGHLFTGVKFEPYGWHLEPECWRQRT